MANVNNIAAKAAKVADIQKKIEAAQSVVIVDYRGLSVLQATELRSLMRAEDVEYLVLKNSMVERAIDAAKIDESIKQYLKGPSAFAFGYEDVVAPARIVNDYFTKVKKGSIKGGLVNSAVTDANVFARIAQLPSRDVLIARILGSMKAPISKLAVALEQIRLQKESGAPVEAAAETAAE